MAFSSARVTLSPLAFVPITVDVSTFTSPEVLPVADSPSSSAKVTWLPSESVATTWSPSSFVTPKLSSVSLLPKIWSPIISLDAVMDWSSVSPAFCSCVISVSDAPFGVELFLIVSAAVSATDLTWDSDNPESWSAETVESAALIAAVVFPPITVSHALVPTILVQFRSSSGLIIFCVPPSITPASTPSPAPSLRPTLVAVVTTSFAPIFPAVSPKICLVSALPPGTKLSVPVVTAPRANAFCDAVWASLSDMPASFARL